jgi:dipeptide transport system permease protein
VTTGLASAGRFLLRRTGLMVLSLVGLMTLIFLMIKLIPGDEALVIAGPDASAEQIAAVKQRYGLDASLFVQYLRFLERLSQGDLGISTSTYQPVLAELQQVLPSTVELVCVTMAFSLLAAIPAATLAAARRGGLFDGSSRLVAVIAGGLPSFWLALMGQYLFASQWRILPISGHVGFGMMVPERTGMISVDALLAGDFEAFRDAAWHIILPAVALAAIFSSQIYRTLRASLIAILEADFIAPVRAKGASFWRILLRHALPNAIGPTLNLAGMQLGAMIGSAVLVESIFGRQGVGSYLTNGVAQKDTFAVVGAVFFVGAIVCIVNFLVDILQILLDPRLRHAQLSDAP